MLGTKAILAAKKCLKAGTAFRLTLENKNKTVIDHNIPFIIHYYNNSIYKHHKPVEKHDKNDPLLPPYPQYREVIHLTDSKADHYVFINILMVALGHVVISSANPKCVQGDRLNISDCSALSQIIQGYNNSGIAYYNCGVESGCSQMHKHVQFVPYITNHLFDELIQTSSSHILNQPSYGFRHYSVKLRNYSAQEILHKYNQLMSQSKWDKAYNFLISNQHAVLIPRKCANHPIYNVNVSSLNFGGHFYLWDTDSPKILTNPLKILQDVCIKW